MIKLKNISKKYRLNQKESESDRLKDFLTGFFKRKQGFEEFWALDDVSFNVEQGEKIGLLGRNGAGKSTLLKVISSITPPTKGTLKVSGRLVSLLEVGSGFHPELTGRENIFLNGAILGMSKKEIEKNFDEIVHFSEVEKFLELPVKRFSSGMYARLGFSVAIHVNPEILIVDEVFSVGDLAFQQKCVGKLEELGKRGVTLLFVGHNLPQLVSICDRGILLEKGKVLFDGPVEKCSEMYAGRVTSETGLWEGSIECDSLNIRRVEICSDKMGAAYVIGKECRLLIFYESQVPSSLFIEIFNSSQELVASSNSDSKLQLGVGRVEFHLDTELFHPGDYFIKVNGVITLSFPLYRKAGIEETFLNSRLNGISLGNRWIYDC